MQALGGSLRGLPRRPGKGSESRARNKKGGRQPGVGGPVACVWHQSTLEHRCHLISHPGVPLTRGNNHPKRGQMTKRWLGAPPWTGIPGTLPEASLVGEPAPTWSDFGSRGPGWSWSPPWMPTLECWDSLQLLTEVPQCTALECDSGTLPRHLWWGSWAHPGVISGPGALCGHEGHHGCPHCSA